MKPFLELEDGNPFYVLPVISDPLFPQFKGPRTPGVMRTKRQKGGCLALPASMAWHLIARLARCIGRISLNPSQFSPLLFDSPLTNAPLAAKDSVPVAEGGSSSCRVFYDLPDPQGHYTMLKATQAYRRYEMCIPPVFTADGNTVVPEEYKDKIPNGTLVAVRGKMKM